jgi:hypothetical protein
MGTSARDVPLGLASRMVNIRSGRARRQDYDGHGWGGICGGPPACGSPCTVHSGRARLLLGEFLSVNGHMRRDRDVPHEGDRSIKPALK